MVLTRLISRVTKTKFRISDSAGLKEHHLEELNLKEFNREELYLQQHAPQQVKHQCTEDCGGGHCNHPGGCYAVEVFAFDQFLAIYLFQAFAVFFGEGDFLWIVFGAGDHSA